MEVQPNIIVPLGYGRYARSDVITVLEPIEDEERGPGRRTKVYVEGRPHPIIASRTEATILRDMTRVPAEVAEARAALNLLQDLLEDFAEVGPMLRRSIREEAGIDIDALEKRLRRVLADGWEG